MLGPVQIRYKITLVLVPKRILRSFYMYRHQNSKGNRIFNIYSKKIILCGWGTILSLFEYMYVRSNIC